MLSDHGDAGLCPAEALEAAVEADTVSLVAFEVGMFTWMAFVYYGLFHRPLRPTRAVFWFMMQIGMITGFLTTYPANWLLIHMCVKVGM